jgi:hypothetical protein
LIINELNQLHFTEDSALYDACYGARNLPLNQPIYIISSQSLCQTTNTGYSRIFSGHYFVRRIIESQYQLDSTFSFTHHPSDGDDNADSQFQSRPDPSNDFSARCSTSTQNRWEQQQTSPVFGPPVDSYRVNMRIAGSLMVQDPHFNSFMTDSGCKISAVFIVLFATLLLANIDEQKF